MRAVHDEIEDVAAVCLVKGHGAWCRQAELDPYRAEGGAVGEEERDAPVIVLCAMKIGAFGVAGSAAGTADDDDVCRRQEREDRVEYVHVVEHCLRWGERNILRGLYAARLVGHI